MTVTPKRLAMALVGATDLLVYTVPSNTTTIIKNIDMMNVTASAVKFSTWVGSLSTSLFQNTLIWLKPIAARQNGSYDGNVVLAAGDKIVVRSTLANSICVIINGVEIT